MTALDGLMAQIEASFEFKGKLYMKERLPRPNKYDCIWRVICLGPANG